MMQAPFYFVSSSSAVSFTPAIAGLLGANPAGMMKKVVLLDWPEINKQRPQLIERFNREVKI
jgi:hypothetical protein